VCDVIATVVQFILSAMTCFVWAVCCK